MEAPAEEGGEEGIPRETTLSCFSYVSFFLLSWVFLHSFSLRQWRGSGEWGALTTHGGRASHGFAGERRTGTGVEHVKEN